MTHVLGLVMRSQTLGPVFFDTPGKDVARHYPAFFDAMEENKREF